MSEKLELRNFVGGEHVDATDGRRMDLVESLRIWLAAHGQWEPAAARLGVHRHTLRKRIRRAEELLDRDLDSPGVRAELWLALHPPGGPPA